MADSCMVVMSSDYCFVGFVQTLQKQNRCRPQNCFPTCHPMKTMNERTNFDIYIRLNFYSVHKRGTVLCHFMKEESGKVLVLTCEWRNQCQSKTSIESIRTSSRKLYWNESRTCEGKSGLNSYIELINFTHVVKPGCQCNRSRTEPKQQSISLTKLVFVPNLYIKGLLVKKTYLAQQPPLPSW